MVLSNSVSPNVENLPDVYDLIDIATPSYINLEKIKSLRTKPNSKRNIIFEAFSFYFGNGNDSSFTKRQRRTVLQWIQILAFLVFTWACAIAPLVPIVTAYYRFRLDLHHPKYSHDILHEPALNYRPYPVDDRKNNRSWGGLVHFNRNDRDHYKYLIHNIDAAVKKYEAHRESKTKQLVEKDDIMWTKVCSFDNPADDEYACSINAQRFGTYCYRNMEYGYPDGQPCFLIRVNKIFHWKPKPYETLQELKAAGFPLHWEEEDFDPRYVPITCTGESPIDDELLGPVDYIYPYEDGKNGIPTYFFPYSHQLNYKAPGVMVNFWNVTTSVVIRIRCLLWAKNVPHIREGFHHNRMRGGVSFELMVDNGIVKRRGWEPETEEWVAIS